MTHDPVTRFSRNGRAFDRSSAERRHAALTQGASAERDPPNPRFHNTICRMEIGRLGLLPDFRPRTDAMPLSPPTLSCIRLSPPCPASLRLSSQASRRARAATHAAPATAHTCYSPSGRELSQRPGHNFSQTHPVPAHNLSQKRWKRWKLTLARRGQLADANANANLPLRLGEPLHNDRVGELRALDRLVVFELARREGRLQHEGAAVRGAVS